MLGSYSTPTPLVVTSDELSTLRRLARPGECVKTRNLPSVSGVGVDVELLGPPWAVEKLFRLRGTRRVQS